MKSKTAFLGEDDDFVPVQDPTLFTEGMAMSAVDTAGKLSIIHAVYCPKVAGGDGWYNLSVNLPDGRIAQGVGKAPFVPGKGAQAGPLIFEQVKPFARWRYRFNGLARVLNPEDALVRHKPDPTRREFSYELEAQCVSAPWQPPMSLWSGSSDDTMLRLFGFYIQHLEVNGRFQLGNEMWELSGTGWRHHVRCAPWKGDVYGHHFVHVMFPSGRIAGFQQVTTCSGESSGVGYFGHRSEFQQASVLEISDWDGLVQSGERISVMLRGEDGSRAKITGVSSRNVSVVKLAESGGAEVDYNDPDVLIALFADTRWTWDGEQAWATWERTRLAGPLSQGLHPADH